MSIIAAFVVIMLAILAIWLLSSVVGSLLGAVIAVLTWAVIGWLTGRLVDRDGKGFGWLTNIGLGLTGGIVGSFVLRLIGLNWVSNLWLVGSIIAGVIGALIVVWVARLLTGGRALR